MLGFLFVCLGFLFCVWFLFFFCQKKCPGQPDSLTQVRVDLSGHSLIVSEI